MDGIIDPSGRGCFGKMLGIYEKRRFADGEKVWLGRYKNLTNLLHWHFECEIIRVVAGCARIKIGDALFDAVEGDCYFCLGGELHYIVGAPDSLIEVLILDQGITEGLTDQYTVASPKLAEGERVRLAFEAIKKERSQKEPFYREAMEHLARGLILTLLRQAPVRREGGVELYRELINKIHREFADITFEEAVRFSGYSPSHFSKVFRRLAGMRFTQYLNMVKVEHAVLLLQREPSVTVTAVSRQCGFSTVRNFNRVFKAVTGYSPAALPKDFTTDSGIGMAENLFDPTGEEAELL